MGTKRAALSICTRADFAASPLGPGTTPTGHLRSDIADRRQAPTGPGAITAALFLEGFVDGRPWAHLDIAGPARSSEEIDEVGPVATGFATRTLLVLLRDLADRPRL